MQGRRHTCKPIKQECVLDDKISSSIHSIIIIKPLITTISGFDLLPPNPLSPPQKKRTKTRRLPTRQSPISTSQIHTIPQSTNHLLHRIGWKTLHYTCIHQHIYMNRKCTSRGVPSLPTSSPLTHSNHMYWPNNSYSHACNVYSSDPIHNSHSYPIYFLINSNI